MIGRVLAGVLQAPTAAPWYGHVGDSLPGLSVSIAKALAILVVTFLISRIVAGRSRAVFTRGGVPVAASILLSRVAWSVAWIVGIVWTFYAVGRDLSPLAAFIGVVGLALSLSLQAVMQNLVAGIYLLIEQPFAIGDTIQVVGPNGANHEGTVEDIEMRITRLRSRDDELIMMPNSSIFGGVVTNRTAVGGYAAHVNVTFPRTSEPEIVQLRLFPVLTAVPSILRHPPPTLRVDTVGESTWNGSLVFWSATPEAVSSAVWAVGKQFPEATIGSPTAA
jgi:small conductance mechanosensitive channel